MLYFCKTYFFIDLYFYRFTMNKQKASIFLFNIAKEVEKSFRSPIIFFTEKDYADYIVRSLIDMHNVLEEDDSHDSLLQTVRNFHFEWLQIVQEIEMFKKKVKGLPREVTSRAIDFTINCLENRYAYIRNYITASMQASMPGEGKELMDSNLKIIEKIKQINHSELLEKKKSIMTLVDQAEYVKTINDELEELLNWLDVTNDNLALHFCKILDLKVPILPSDLTNTLKRIIDEVSDDPDPESQKIASDINSKGRRISKTIRLNSIHEIEIEKLVRKIKELENLMTRLQLENSSALTAVKHKTIYLEDRLQSLENVKLSLVRLKPENSYKPEKEHIFNHLLPQSERRRLVEQLINLWNSIAENENKSIISILSVADFKEDFNDNYGHFCVDKYGRKLYIKDNDEQLYQLNEINKLVPVKDDINHIYYYDDCGRYYLNKDKQRVYKADSTASEYLLSKNGTLVKFKELKNGVEYFYDTLGRYYINKDGKRIYSDDNGSEYEEDGLGNLFKLNSRHYAYDNPTPKALTLNENKYLKEVVGAALKACIAKVVVCQPNDPIEYLSESLIKYRRSVQERDIRLEDKRAMFEERNLYSMTKENSVIQLKEYEKDYTMAAEDASDHEYESQETKELYDSDDLADD